MTDYEHVFFMIQEAVDSDIITIEEGTMLNDYAYEIYVNEQKRLEAPFNDIDEFLESIDLDELWPVEEAARWKREVPNIVQGVANRENELAAQAKDTRNKIREEKLKKLSKLRRRKLLNRFFPGLVKDKKKALDAKYDPRINNSRAEYRIHKAKAAQMNDMKEGIIKSAAGRGGKDPGEIELNQKRSREAKQGLAQLGINIGSATRDKNGKVVSATDPNASPQNASLYNADGTKNTARINELKKKYASRLKYRKKAGLDTEIDGPEKFGKRNEGFAAVAPTNNRRYKKDKLSAEDHRDRLKYAIQDIRDERQDINASNAAARAKQTAEEAIRKHGRKAATTFAQRFQAEYAKRQKESSAKRDAAFNKRADAINKLFAKK